MSSLKLFLKKLFSKGSGGVFKFFRTIFILFAALIIFWWIWSYMTVGFLIGEGEFDDVKSTPVSDQTPPTDQPAVDYDYLTDKINRIDFDALPDDLMVSQLLSDQYLFPKDYAAETLLKSYLLFAEICGNDAMEQGGSTQVKPYMLYGLWYHETAMKLASNAFNPYEAWTTLFAPQISIGGRFTKCGTFGQSAITFAEEVDPGDPTLSRSANITKAMKALTPVPTGYGLNVLYISSVENPNISQADRFNISTYNSELGGLASKLTFTQHSLYPWSESFPQRPSVTFLPDVSATTAYWAALMFAGKDATFGNKANDFYLQVPQKFSDGSLSQEYMSVVAFISKRAGKQDKFLYGEEASLMKVVPYLLQLDNEAGLGMEYFCGDAFITKYKNATTAFDASLSNFAKELYGSDGFKSFASGDGILPQNVREAISTDLGGSTYAEDLKAPLDGVYVISAGKQLVKAIDALADAVLATEEYNKPTTPTRPVIGSGKFGVNSLDRVNNQTGEQPPDGLCDTCGGSVFESPVNGCSHSVSSQWYFPAVGGKILYINDYHGANSGCSTHGGVAHEAYDIQKSEGAQLRAIVDGEKVGPIYGGAYGYHYWVLYPNKNSYQLCFSYAHMVKPEGEVGVEKTTPVKAGDPIGQMGSTGWVTGPHLHLQISTDWSTAPKTSVDYLSYYEGIPIWLGTKSKGYFESSPYVKMD